MRTIRHLYVAESRRGSGIGRLLIARIIEDAGRHFREINTRAPAAAFGFYERLRFRRIVDAETVTHRLVL
jgi:GNAT superfamily N-acetyltransferase